MRREVRAGVALVPLIALLAGAPALAHEEAGSVGGFLSGLNHPFSGWDHLLAMFAVGLWGAQLGPPAIYVLPITFPLVMALGGFFGLIGVSLPATEIGIAASAIVLGLAVAVQARPLLWISMVVVAVFAIFHGYAHGTELETGADASAYSLGFVIATGLLHAFGIAVGSMHRWTLGQRAIQAMGATVALVGAGFLARAVA